MKIKVEKLKQYDNNEYDFLLPKKAYLFDAGADVKTPHKILLKKGETKKIPLGIRIEIPKFHFGVFHSKSGLASKGIVVQNCPIDYGYVGECLIIISNISNQEYIFDKGDKVGQLVIHKDGFVKNNLTGRYEFGKINKNTSRGEGGFGSTGK